jgi:hypothetical protein
VAELGEEERHRAGATPGIENVPRVGAKDALKQQPPFVAYGRVGQPMVGGVVEVRGKRVPDGRLAFVGPGSHQA